MDLGTLYADWMSLNGELYLSVVCCDSRSLTRSCCNTFTGNCLQPRSVCVIVCVLSPDASLDQWDRRKATAESFHSKAVNAASLRV